MKVFKSFIVSIIASLFLLFATSFAATDHKTTTNTKVSGQFNPQQVRDIQKVVHDYLMQNPQVIVQVLRKLQQQQQVEMEKQAIKAIHTNANSLFDNPMSPVVGNHKGKVTLVEFFDYQCPHCKAMAPAIENLLTKDKDIRVVFKEFPIFPGSMFAAKAALAAKKQNKYLEFHNALMADKNPLTKEDVINTAKKVGLDIALMEKDMQSKEIRDELTNNLKLAQAIGLAGTPAFIVQSNEEQSKTFFVPGQVSEDMLQKLINKAS